MNIKPILINTALAFALSGCLAQAESVEDQPQVNIASEHYEVASKYCEEYCTAKVQADEYEIFVEYKLDDASVEFLDILNVVRHDQTINAYVDRSEIQKINAAIIGGAK
ncbi:MAG: hypothetical protein RRZ32_00395 [Acinetobacter sp.]